MGRKQAPQPLSLAESQSRVHAGSNPNSSNGSAAISPSAFTSSAPNSSALRPQDHRDPRGIDAGSETNLQVIPTPTGSSKSPRSPRSPFSKFNTSKKAEGRQVHTSHAQSPAHLQSKFSTQQPSEYPQLDYKAGPVAQNYEQEYYHYPPDSRANPPEPQEAQQNLQDESALASSRSQINLTAGPTTPTLIREGAGTFRIAGSKTPARQHQQTGREEEKHTRSASRFFNFKSSKTSQHRREQTRDPLPKRDLSHNSRANSENGGSEGMSRGLEQRFNSDRSATQSSRHQGTFDTLGPISQYPAALKDCISHESHCCYGRVR